MAGTTPGWVQDVLPGHDQLTLTLDAPAEPGEPVPPVATLVRHGRPGPARPAVLYVHGWNDYYFQVHVAEFFERLGYAFYALDLRRYGRSLRDGQYGGYVTDLKDYDEELDLARETIRAAGHPSVVLHGHSTGGLVSALHASRRAGEYAALVLNAPWLDLHNQPLVRALAHGIDAAGAWRPTSVLPGSNAEVGPGHYAKTLHRSWDGEWDYDLAWKSNSEVFALRAGWMRAIIRGQRRVSRGLSIGCPVLVLTAATSSLPRTYEVDSCSTADIVLDVKALATRAVRLGPLVTVVRIVDGMHDLALSRTAAREQYLAELERWLGCYGPLSTRD